MPSNFKYFASFERINLSKAFYCQFSVFKYLPDMGMQIMSKLNVSHKGDSK